MCSLLLVFDALGHGVEEVNVFALPYRYEYVSRVFVTGVFMVRCISKYFFISLFFEKLSTSSSTTEASDYGGWWYHMNPLSEYSCRFNAIKM